MLKDSVVLEMSTHELIDRLKNGERHALARAITLAESTREDHQDTAEVIMDACMDRTGKSLRIGITGVPGVGKSTFIESFGNYLIDERGKKVAVIAVDPSSKKSKGSILGDKTRMSTLAASANSFIRPSPSSGSMGGIGLASREVILLCEAAGYDIVLVETVGVGQSETEVKDIVDFFMLLMLPGAGDELQGIKRGIIELSDAIFINKADGDNLLKAKQAKASYTSALQLFPSSESGWQTAVELCSGQEGINLDLAWEMILKYIELTRKNGYFEKFRQKQLEDWFKYATESRILSKFHHKKNFESLLSDYRKRVLGNKLSPRKASRLFVEELNAQK